MLAIIGMLAFISIGGVVGSAFFKKKYEETTVISVSAIILIMFLFGIFKHLKAGLIVECIICVLCYLVSIVYVVKKRDFKSFARCLFTPGFSFYIITTILLSILLSGKCFEAWDEFSHWGDVVKAMVTIDDFSTSPISYSQFQSYPPAMAILQYCTEKLNSFITGEQFVEWITYPTYFMFVAAFILPCFRGFEKFDLRSLFLCLVVFGVPLVFYPNFYSCLYIDPALSVLLFIGLYFLFTYKADDPLFIPHIACVCSILPITKDAGLLFSVFIGVAAVCFALVHLIAKRKSVVGSIKPQVVNSLISIILIAGSIVLPKVLWNYSIDSNHAIKSFAGKVDFGVLINVIIKRDTSYRREVLGNYVREFFKNGISNNGVLISYFALTVLFVIGLLYFSKKLTVTSTIDKHSKYISLVTIVFVICIYIFGVCVMYMFKFSEFEAVHLASFNRYLNILYCGLGYLLSVMIVSSLTNKDKWKMIAVFCVVLLFSPLDYYSRLFRRKLVVESQQYRRLYISVTASLNDIHQDGDKVYILSQEDNGEDYEIIKYLSRPHTTYTGWRWSIGDAPYYDGDIYTQTVEHDKWINDLFDEYSYLIVYESNEWFSNTYSEYFDGDINERQIYRIDPSVRKLIPVQQKGSEYINSLCDQDYTVFISFKEDGPLVIDSEIKTSLENLGVDIEYIEDSKSNSISIINNGSLIESECSEQRIEREGRFDLGHAYKVVLDGDEGQIIVDGLDYSNNKRGINVVVYDNKQNCVVDSVNIDTYADEQVVRRYL